MMPDFLTGDVKDFILKLLVKDPRKRLGGDPSDAEAVKNHKFFVPSLNWDDLLRKNIPAPFIPRISAAMDVSNFSEEFTNMPAVDSPSVAPPNVENVFSGYSYVAPSVVLEHYTTTVPTASNAPSLPIGSSNNSIESHQETDSAQNKINAHRVILTPEEEEDMFRPNPDKRPSASNLVGCKLQVYISSYIPIFVSIHHFNISNNNHNINIYWKYHFQNSAFFRKYDIDIHDTILGDGSFSVCRRCVCRSTGQEFAVKIVSRRVDCTNEIRLLRLCQGHPNIVQLVDVLQVCNRERYTMCTSFYMKCNIVILLSMLLTLRIDGVEGHPRVYVCVRIFTMTGCIPKRSMCDIILSYSLRARQI